MIDLTGVKNIIFDYGGVIINIDFKLTINAFKELGFLNVEECVFQSKGSDLLVKMEKGHISIKEFRTEIRNISKLNLTDVQIDFAWNALLLDMPVKRINLIEKLKTKYRIFLLSNTNKLHYNSYLKTLQTEFGYTDFNALFEKAWFSHDLGLIKPTAEIYNYVLNDASIKPQETLFIDDCEVNIIGARNVGLKVHHLYKEDILNLFDLF
jgi:putative hydrolase of the HAD superfamily